MQDKKDPILNKYDVHNVESKLNDFFTETIVEELKCRKVIFHEYFKLVFGFVFSAVILKSYFHKTPFPQDKPLIALCVILYGLMNLINTYYTKIRLRGAFNEFIVNKEALPKNYENLKGKGNELELSLKLRSQVKEFSNQYTIIAMIGDRKAQETVAYNDYIDSEGFIVEEKAKQLLAKLLKAL